MPENNIEIPEHMRELPKGSLHDLTSRMEKKKTVYIEWEGKVFGPFVFKPVSWGAMNELLSSVIKVNEDGKWSVDFAAYYRKAAELVTEESPIAVSLILAGPPGFGAKFKEHLPRLDEAFKDSSDEKN